MTMESLIFWVALPVKAPWLEADSDFQKALDLAENDEEQPGVQPFGETPVT